MKLATDWKDYAVLATGDGYKLERWGGIVLLRPDPQVIWGARRDLFADPSIHAVYHRSEKGGGIGLYVVKYIMERHGGSAKAENDGGLKIQLFFPKEET